jgi:hypothetical protein
MKKIYEMAGVDPMKIKGTYLWFNMFVALLCIFSAIHCILYSPFSAKDEGQMPLGHSQVDVDITTGMTGVPVWPKIKISHKLVEKDDKAGEAGFYGNSVCTSVGVAAVTSGIGSELHAKIKRSGLLDTEIAVEGGTRRSKATCPMVEVPKEKMTELLGECDDNLLSHPLCAGVLRPLGSGGNAKKFRRAMYDAEVLKQRAVMEARFLEEDEEDMAVEEEPN